MPDELIRPMLASQGQLPSGDGWAFEFKWDGVRAVSYVAGTVRVMSRTDRDISTTYPELAALSGLISGLSAVLDGEVVALDEHGLPSFGRLQSRMHVLEPDVGLVRRIPVSYYVFDVLRLDGFDTVDLPYVNRRELLDSLELSGDSAIRVSPYFTETSGRDVLAAAREYGLEGVIAKRVDARYEPGRRAHSWIKVPLINTQEVVVGGWRPGAGRRMNTVGSLLVGAYSQGELVYLGHVGTGFTDPMLVDLRNRVDLLGQARSPFVNQLPREHSRDAQWIRPELVGEVEYRQITADGLLRHASWRGLRNDKQPEAVGIPAILAER